MNTTSVEVACRNNLLSFLQAIPQKVQINLSKRNTKFQNFVKKNLEDNVALNVCLLTMFVCSITIYTQAIYY